MASQPRQYGFCRPPGIGRAAGLLVLVVPLALALASCGGAQIDTERLTQVKTTAVVTLSVPREVVYLPDEVADEQAPAALLQAQGVMADLTAADGERAAALTYDALVAALNPKLLGFEVLAASEVAESVRLQAVTERHGDSQAMTTVGALNVGATPPGLPGLPLIDGEMRLAIVDSFALNEMLRAAAEALRVDALLVVSDPGMAFVCSSCKSLAGLQAGQVTTRAQFTWALVAADGKVIAAGGGHFAATPASATMLAGTVNPIQHTDLYEAHGRALARALTEDFRLQAGR